MLREFLFDGPRKTLQNSGLEIAAVSLAESVDGIPTISEANCSAVPAALRAAGVIFLAANGDGAGVRLRKSTETAGKLTQQIDAIGKELTRTDHDAPIGPAKPMQQLEDAYKADKAVKLKNKRAKIEQK